MHIKSKKIKDFIFLLYDYKKNFYSINKYN